MKTCKCGSTRILAVSAKCSDLFSINDGKRWHNGYVPANLNLGDDEDYLEFDFCADCGLIQDFTPLSDDAIRKALNKAN